MNAVFDFFTRHPLTWEFWVLLGGGLVVIWGVFFFLRLRKKSEEGRVKSEEKSSVDFLQQILDLDHTHENYFLDVQSIFRELLSHHLDQDVRSMVIEEIIEIDVIPEDLQQVTRHIRDAHYLAQHEFDARELHEKLVGSVRELLKEEV